MVRWRVRGTYGGCDKVILSKKVLNIILGDHCGEEIHHNTNVASHIDTHKKIILGWP